MAMRKIRKLDRAMIGGWSVEIAGLDFDYECQMTSELYELGKVLYTKLKAGILNIVWGFATAGNTGKDFDEISRVVELARQHEISPQVVWYLYDLQTPVPQNSAVVAYVNDHEEGMQGNWEPYLRFGDEYLKKSSLVVFVINTKGCLVLDKQLCEGKSFQALIRRVLNYFDALDYSVWQILMDQMATF